jgi:phage FluMu gp28-like protein
MTEVIIDIERPNLTGYQKDILYCNERFTVTEASTKVGKTFSHLYWIFEQANDTELINKNYWWVAPVYSQAKIAFTRMRRTIASYRQYYRINESGLFIQCPNGNTIWFKSAEKPDNLYGEDVVAAVFDEFTRAREEAWTALRSTLTATRGKCKFIGNVRGKNNWGYRLGVRARSATKDYKYFKLTAWDAVDAGILEREEVEQAKIDLPDKAFRQLYLGEALDDNANPFGEEFIKKSIRKLSTQPTVAFGVDLAKSHDWTVIVGLDQHGLISHFDRWQSDWGQTTNRVIQTIGRVPAYIDSTGVGTPIVENITRACSEAEGFTFTSKSKQEIMEGLASSIQKGDLYTIEEMRDELESFEFVYSSTGVKYSAPEGMHDDIVCALALANAMRSKPKIKLRVL